MPRKTVLKFIVSGVRRSGEHELSILTGVELAVKRGETIALIGESGSGKSTLLAILRRTG